MFRQIQSGSSSLGLRQVRRVVIFVVGMTVLLFGLALIVLPGPAFLVVPAGLAILGLEFRWARRWMRRAREMFDTTFSRKRVPAKPETEKRGAVEKIGV
jgi:tellurite resistance protein TerC